MRFIIGLVSGFVLGCFYALHQTVEAPDGITVKLMKMFKSLLEVF